MHRVIVFGGGSGGSFVNDTWQWTGSDWSRVRTTGAPSPREGARMTFDRSAGRIVLFGGQQGKQQTHDTWTLHAKNG
ncbi:MAG: hypothetical protein E6G57_00585 [Actinobacteria bacterium]|nr:MAG: hypothetical protein E6G57_00585 [Actinomycetota bacterium]